MMEKIDNLFSSVLFEFWLKMDFKIHGFPLKFVLLHYYEALILKNK